LGYWSRVDGEAGRWRDREMERRRDGEMENEKGRDGEPPGMEPRQDFITPKSKFPGTARNQKPVASSFASSYLLAMTSSQ